MPRKPWADILLLLLLLAPALTAQGGEEATPAGALEGRPVVRVEVGRTLRYPEERIRACLHTRVGKVFSRLQVDQDVKRLWDYLRLPSTVLVTPLGKGVAIRFELLNMEARGIYEITRIVGHWSLKEDEIRKIMRLPKGAALDFGTALSKRQPLLARLERMGHIFADVELQPQPDGRTLVFRVKEGPRVKVRSFVLEGNKSFPTDVTLGLAYNVLGSAGVDSKPTTIVAQEVDLTRLSTWLLSPMILLGRAIDPLLKPTYSPTTLAEDLDKIRDFYRSQGFREARAELVGVRFNRAFDRVDIRVLIHEGPRYRVSSVDLEAELPPGREKPLVDKGPLLAQLKLRPGMFYTTERVQRDGRTIQKHYNRRGFITFNARDQLRREETFEVLLQREIYDPETATVAVTYRVREGFPKKLRRIRIAGNRNTREEVIRREIGLHPGDPLDMVELQESLIRLDGLQYFNTRQGVSSVKNRFLSVPDSPDEVDLEVELEEGRSGNLLFSAGATTNAGFFGRFTIRRQNFDATRLPEGYDPLSWIGQIIDRKAFYGGGQTLSLDLAPGTQVSFFNISFRDPDVLGRHEEPISLNLNFYKRLRYFRDYNEDKLGGGLRLGRRFGRRTAVSLGLTAETVDIDDIDADAPVTVWNNEGSSEFRILDMVLSHDGRDHPIQPSSGAKITFGPILAGGFLGGSNQYWGLTSKVEGYLPLFEDGKGRPHVLGLRAEFDWRKPFGDSDEIHVSRRLFLGGRGTIRGFRYRGAGPTQFGNPTGGEAMWSSSLEYLVPIFSIQPERGGREIDMVRLVFFADAGALGTTLDSSNFNEIRLAAGFGLRVKIPGLSNIPVALDFGFPIRREETDDREVFSFVLGIF